MALSRTQSVITYASASGGQSYYFDVVVDAQGLVSVRNIRGPKGLITDSITSVPTSVMDDITEAKYTTTQLLHETQVVSGNIVFAGVASMAVVIAPGVLNNANYRVVYTTPDGTILRTTGKTATGFTAEAPAIYGTVLVPITVTYVILVATQQVSTTSGTVTLTDADGGSKAVVFTAALSTAAYRVVFSPNGFFTATATSKAKTGFTIILGQVLGAGQSVTVGYDVFVG